MDAESIAALAMCGMVGEAALPSIKTPIGDIHINEDVDVRYNSDGGFYRARVSAIEEDAIRVTYPEDQTWHESTETIPIADVTSERMRLSQGSALAAAAAAAADTRPRLGRKHSPELWQAGSPVEEDAPDSPRVADVLGDALALPQHRPSAASTGGRARRPVKRAGAGVASEVDYQPKVKRSRLKSVDVITTADTPFPGWTMERRKTWREKYGVKWDTIYRPPTDFRFGKKPKATKMARSQNDIRQYVRAHSDCTNGLSPEAFVSRFSFTWNLAAQNRAS